MTNRGVSKPWRGTARFVVWFAKKPNRAVAGQFTVRQDTNQTVAVRYGPCEPPRLVEPWTTLTSMDLHPIQPRSEPQIQNANPRSAATPANRSLRNAILPTHTEWTTMALGGPFATPTNFTVVFTTKARLYAAVLMHQNAMNYAAVSTHQCSTDTLWCLHTNALRICCGVYTPMLYGYAAVSTHSSATKYATVFHSKALLLYTLRCSQTKAMKYAVVSTPKLRDAERSIISIEADVVRRCLLF